MGPPRSGALCLHHRPTEMMTRPDLTSSIGGDPDYTHKHGPWAFGFGPGRYTGVGAGLEVDPQASRAPEYSGNNFPQYLRPDSSWGDAPDPGILLDCQQAVQPGSEQQ